MTDTEASPVAPTPVKVAKVKKTPKPKKTTSHPPYLEMITEAISSLKEKKGSSRQAIKKYLVKNYKINDDNVSIGQMKLALRRGVDNGVLKQSKGTGASGSFKLGETPKSEKKATKPVKKTVKKAKSPKKAVKPKSPAKKSAKKVAAKKPAAKKPAAKKVVKKPAAKKPAAKKAVKAKKVAKKAKK